jgi:hypothetical protein
MFASSLRTRSHVLITAKMKSHNRNEKNPDREQYKKDGPNPVISNVHENFPFSAAEAKRRSNVYCASLFAEGPRLNLALDQHGNIRIPD